MITQERAEEKLKELADHFDENFRQKKYAEAKACYNTALTVVTFLELPEERKIYYFGARDPEPVEGLFQEEKVIKTMEECIFKEKREREEQEKRRKAHERYQRHMRQLTA